MIHIGVYADAILNGEACEWCGVELKGESGYPRLCKHCAKGYPDHKWRAAEEDFNEKEV